MGRVKTRGMLHGLAEFGAGRKVRGEVQSGMFEIKLWEIVESLIPVSGQMLAEVVWEENNIGGEMVK